jgi:hypothetical protein
MTAVDIYKSNGKAHGSESFRAQKGFSWGDISEWKLVMKLSKGKFAGNYEEIG